MQISPARIAAYEVLQGIESWRAFSSVLLAEAEDTLDEKDRALCHELVMGVLRRQIFLDRVIEQFSGSKKLDTAVRLALRLGIYQIKFLDKVPSYSAINESVNLVQRARKTSAKGFVNAILRRVSKEDVTLEFTDEVDRVSVETSHPRWLIEKWIGEFGAADAEQLAVGNNAIPRIAFRLTKKGATLPEFKGAERSKIVDDAFVVSGMSAELKGASAEGEIYFQDEASQLVAEVVSKNLGARFIDICAAPGGKTTQIAAGARDTMIVAGDLHTSRVQLLRATCRKQGADHVNVVQYDAEYGLPFADESFDTVLVDAPCSGTGTIRHNPELRYFLDPGDFGELAAKQRAILRNASKLVREGGTLVYSTCSMEREENEAVCSNFLAKSAGFTQMTPDVPSRIVTEDGFARTFPHRDGVDGFFIAVFERT